MPHRYSPKVINFQLPVRKSVQLFVRLACHVPSVYFVATVILTSTNIIVVPRPHEATSALFTTPVRPLIRLSCSSVGFYLMSSFDHCTKRHTWDLGKRWYRSARCRKQKFTQLIFRIFDRAGYNDSYYPELLVKLLRRVAGD